MSDALLKLTVNGEPVQARVPANRLLADFLREDLHLTGTKRGCETGTCGACTVLRDGRPVKACLSLAVMADGAEVRTVEGLATRDGLAGGERLHPLQAAFMACGALQCGYCTPGMLMSAQALLAAEPRPTEAQVRHGLAGNLCRCTGYTQIVEAVQAAAEVLRGD